MKNKRIFIIVLAISLCLNATTYQTQAQEPTAKKGKSQTVAPQAGSSPVVGSGSPGRLSKWTGVFGTETYSIGNSNIFEDKFGNIGIGTTTPTSLLTIRGMVEITLGGLKFPDGSLQTTAFNANQVVRSLNGLTGDVQLAAGANITITPSGNTLTIAATNALTGVTHNATLTGNGTQASPLGVAVPLVLNGAGGISGIIEATNTTTGAPGVLAQGGDSDSLISGGEGVIARGGDGNSSDGGEGVQAVGGAGSGAGKFGGHGIVAFAGSGLNGATSGLAGQFVGNVQVTGTLSKGGGSFKIDHPLDPENKYLSHSFVESPDMMNIYNGNVTTDDNGNAVIEMPDYFSALNRDFRYQLTVIGTFAQAIVAEKVKGNRFRIKTNAPGVEVSWQVTGIRQDAWAGKNRIPVEEDKPERERGHYLHPEAFDQPEEKSVNWARDPELMQQLKQRRLSIERLPGVHKTRQR